MFAPRSSMTHSGPICSYKPVYGRFALWAALLVAGPACFNPGPKPPLDEGGDASTGDGQEPGAEDGGSTSGSSDGGAPSQAEACEAYCSLMGDVCDATLPQYSSELSCLAVCERMNLGTPEDVLGNTVGCRTHHGLLASESPDPHCMHAGPTGDGTCGAPCESFCSLALTTCTGELFPWLDAEDCIAECREWPEEPRYEANVPDDATYACHMKHLTLAALQPEVHCNHIGPDTPVCVAP